MSTTEPVEVPIGMRSICRRFERWRNGHKARLPIHSGDQCPECHRGKVYHQKEPATLVRFVGHGFSKGKIGGRFWPGAGGAGGAPPSRIRTG